MRGSAGETEGCERLQEGMLTVKEASAFARLSRAEVYAAMGRGELRSYKYGRRRLLAKADVITWLASKLVPVT